MMQRVFSFISVPLVGSPIIIKQVWDLTAGKLLHDFKFHEGHIRSIDFHPLEFLLATGEHVISMWLSSDEACLQFLHVNNISCEMIIAALFTTSLLICRYSMSDYILSKV